MTDTNPNSAHPDATASSSDSDSARERRNVRRRDLLFGAGGAALGAAATWGASALAASGFGSGLVPYPGSSGAPEGAGATSGAQAGEVGAATVDCHGAHQAGVVTTPQAFLVLTAYELTERTDRQAMHRLMRLWTEDIERMTQGHATVTDTEPELSHLPASLTVTLGLGPDLFDKLGIPERRPAWLQQLPPYPIDKLEDEWTGGDLCLQVCADDPITAAHAARVLTKEAVAYATPKWTQYGSRNAPGATEPGATMRNHFGQLDGTRNPQPEEEPGLIFRSDSEPWLDGGSTMVVRRIHMNLDTWDELDAPARDVVLGRRHDTGAPLTGQNEFDEPDLEATNDLGFPVIDVAAHIRRARTDDGSQRILRRPYNYVSEPRPGEISNVGLVFIAFQADLEHQYLPLQERLGALDLLNTWTTPIGSAVFAIPRGFQPGEVLCEDLFA
ncbi:MAG: Dyp-type peroxidase [Bowdeniella nasicola]|nr:Dyp-type peroxidase [Bowdeniella nasicola]